MRDGSHDTGGTDGGIGRSAPRAVTGRTTVLGGSFSTTLLLVGAFLVLFVLFWVLVTVA